MLVNLNEVLYPAKEGRYAVGLFNAVNLEQAKGIIAAAHALRAPVIFGTAEVFLGITSLEETADMLIPMARRASVPVVVHFDHGLTYEACVRALQLGFSSVMYDCSADAYPENVRKVTEIVRIAHAMGASVEGELGHVGNGSETDPSAFYTQPELASDFVNSTGVDALAIAAGTAHGDYKLPPKLDFARIETIAKAVRVPLVLHGGSGLSDADFARAIASGISKVNVFTDLDRAAALGAQEALLQGKDKMTAVIPYQVAAVKAAVEEKIRLFNGK